MAGGDADLRFIAVVIFIIGAWGVFNILLISDPPPNSGLISHPELRSFDTDTDILGMDLGAVGVFLNYMRVLFANVGLMMFTQPELALINLIVFPSLLVILVVVIARFIWPVV